jgi:hypothetical protein
MRNGFDSDGVIYNYSDSVYATMCLPEINLGHLWKSGPTPKSFWNYYEEWKKPDGSYYTFAEYKEIVDYGVDKGIVFGPGFFRPNAKESIDRVRAKGHKVVILTDRFFGSDPENSHRNTYAAFKDEGIEFDEIHFTKDKTSVHVDTMVEDKLENYDALIAAGIPTWLINRAWNEVPGGDARKRISDVIDYADVIDEISRDRVLDLTFV